MKNFIYLDMYNLQAATTCKELYSLNTTILKATETKYFSNPYCPYRAPLSVGCSGDPDFLLPCLDV